MYPAEVREQALQLLQTPRSLNAISNQLGVARSTLRTWRDHPVAHRPRCVRCGPEPGCPPQRAYAHLLGLYLGDGCLSRAPRDVFFLRIVCCNDYPHLVDECETSLLAVRPGRVWRVAAPGCTHVTAAWKHWPCLFPQHGAGSKHTRTIELEPWQIAIVEHHPGPFLRGLFHSDGCRVANWTERMVAGQRKRYTYPRYFFTQKSTDIMGLCQWALGLLGIGYTMPTPDNLSVARKADVAALDEHVGPKS